MGGEEEGPNFFPMAEWISSMRLMVATVLNSLVDEHLNSFLVQK